jgi:hypothetical protein
LALLPLFLSTTGILLNHTNTLSLSDHPINNALLLKHYAISSPNDIRFYQQGSLIVTNNLFWLNNKFLLESASSIISATFIRSDQEEKPPIILLISSDQIYFFNQEGDLIDQIGEELGLPKNINAVSIDGRNIIFRSQIEYFQTTSNFLSYKKINLIIEPNWIRPIRVSKKTREQAILAYRSKLLSLERIILDAHTGRILGFLGVLFMDLIAILLILLSISGVYIWIRSFRTRF